MGDIIKKWESINYDLFNSYLYKSIEINTYEINLSENMDDLHEQSYWQYIII